MWDQAKYIKVTWSSDFEGGRDCAKFTGTKKCSDDGKELNKLVELATAKALKINKMYKAKYMDDSKLEYELDHFNFKNI